MMGWILCKKFVVALVLMPAVLVLCSRVPAADAKVYIDIHAPSATRFPVVVSQFQSMGGQSSAGRLTAEMPAVISDDLEFSGFFTLIDPGAVDAAFLSGITRDKINWDVVSLVGAEAVVTGGLSVENSRLTAELRLFDAVQGRFITGKRYQGGADDYRFIAHRFADEIFLNLSGERGIFTTKLAFVVSRNGSKELAIMDYDGSGMKTITSFSTLSLSPAWSPDGKSIAFTSYKDGNPDLFVLDVASGATERISRKRGINIAPAWSPDGKTIALTLSLNNGNSEIYVMALEDRVLKRLTHDWSTDVSPAWSPDGNHIAFVSSRSGSPQIYSLTLQTGSIRRLTYEGGYNTSPAWSPRGDKIAYTGRKNGEYNIYVISPKGDMHQQLTASQGDNEDPAWSPDGRYLTFSSTRTGRKEIYIMRCDGSGQKRVSYGEGEKSDPSWSPVLNQELN